MALSFNRGRSQAHPKSSGESIISRGIVKDLETVFRARVSTN